MNAPSKRFAVIGAAALLALFVTGCIIGRTLSLPVPATGVGLALALVGLRLGVMAAALQEPGAPAGTLPASADARGPAARAGDARRKGVAAARADARRPSAESAA